MGVLPCHRQNCENIMCDVYVDGIGYICNDCESEFKDYLEKKGIETITEGKLKQELKIFMVIEKNHFVEGEEISVDDFFKNYTR